MLQRDTTVGTVFLGEAAERRLHAHVLRAGGRIITTAETTAAEAVADALETVQRTLAVLELLVEPDDLLPPVIQDVVPRA